MKMSTVEVKAIILRLAKNKAPGPNGIRNEVYQSLANSDEGLEAITSWINQVFSGTSPLPSRDARLGAIPKKQFSTNPEDMRLLAMMNTDAKIIELCLKHLIRKNAPSMSTFQECQAGFTDQRMALEQAVKLRYALLLDIKKAFDSVPHSMILGSLKEKAEQVPSNEQPASLQVSSFITKWTQIATKGHVYNDDGTEAGSFLFKRGVPQGGVLSPWLFNLCMDKLLESLISNFNLIEVLAYADDICLAGENHVEIQKAAIFVDKWLIENGMQLSYQKCESINLGKDIGKNPFTIAWSPIISRLVA
eukprot:GHVP01019631.1.p1 GENE.GHVP01019631.1~~GHVP01019631.1.p1  ORF type:complete len:305 (+),score=45.54 GHVP01019631.1:511-1425(+)